MSELRKEGDRENKLVEGNGRMSEVRKEGDKGKELEEGKCKNE